ncbi:MAG TPA: transglutaminase domain-containing protein [Burkholderiales bacterium]
MCMQSSSVVPYQKWHWSGDEIVHESSIPASRPLPGRGLRRRYPIDIREFLSIEGNAVVRRELGRLYRRLRGEERLRFLARAPGNFDFRAERVLRFFRRRVRFIEAQQRHVDDWLFPEETLARGGGDCEDLAFLLAAMLEESGISADCLRVALGTVALKGPGWRQTHDHVWVVYQNERGAWEILEPLAHVAQAADARAARGRQERAAAAQGVLAEYMPHYVFNRRHLWRVRVPDAAAVRGLRHYLPKRRFWSRYDPGFAMGVHEQVLDEALGSALGADELAALKRASAWVDVNVLAYDPRDHFDFAYIDAGWERVSRRLASGKLGDFALAAHGIADFYAHSLYGHFGPQRDGRLALYDPARPLPAQDLAYDFFGRLGMPGGTADAATAQDHWQGQLISGQWWRWFTTYPKALKSPEELRWRRCLPDHDRLAVDAPQNAHGAGHLYTADAYAEQFRLRRDAAVRHVRSAYAGWKRAA